MPAESSCAMIYVAQSQVPCAVWSEEPQTHKDSRRGGLDYPLAHGYHGQVEKEHMGTGMVVDAL